jgi:hypothetical protein
MPQGCKVISDHRLLSLAVDAVERGMPRFSAAESSFKLREASKPKKINPNCLARLPHKVHLSVLVQVGENGS